MKFKYKLPFIFLIIILLSSIINAEGFFAYMVKRGDSLSSIASMFNTSINEILKYNDIKNPDLIYVNQLIKIPESSAQIYTIKRGDSLNKIAARFQVSIAELIKINKIKNPDKIYVGDNLIIPDKGRDYQLASRKQSINYIWPVQGKISSEYGWRDHPVYKERVFHTGIDIAVPYGTPVYATESGIVEFCGWSEGYGNLVIIRHRDNSLTYYGHNLKLLVKKGDEVKQGKIIALSGNSGVSTGPHLHFEIRINNQHTNPLRYLNTKYLENNFST